MYGDPLLAEMYASDESLTELEKCECMLDEILHDLNVRKVNELKDGDMFGEQAILRENVRTASIRCMEDTHLAYITKSDFQKMYNSIMKAKQDRRIQFLKAIPLFSQLSKHYLQKMTGMFRRKDFIRNQIVFQQSLIGSNSLHEVKKAYRANANQFINYGFMSSERKLQMVRSLYIIAQGEFEVTIKTYSSKVQ